MFSLTASHRYYLYSGAADMRASFDGLCCIVQQQLGSNPMSGDVYIFLNKRRNLIKLLHWEEGGFAIYYKRLELGTVELPAFDSGQYSCTIKWSELVMMVEGISLKDVKRRKRY
jgi:transposase